MKTKRSISIVVVTFALIAFSSYASEIGSRDIIKVGPIFATSSHDPAKWSPDGTMLGYFNNNVFLTADTLGYSREIAKIDLAPFKFEWISNSSVLAHLRQQTGYNTISHKLVKIDLADGLISSVVQFANIMHQKDNLDQMVLNGPYKTFEGSTYYEYGSAAKNNIVVVRDNAGGDKSTIEHVIRTGEDAIYLVNTDQSDSIKISNKPYKPYLPVPIVVSPDTQYAVTGGCLIRLKDDVLILLDTLIGDVPEGTDGCGFGNVAFNPNRPEVLFRRTCDNGHDYLVRTIGVYDYSTGEYEFIAAGTDLNNCNCPMYSPNGQRISFISDGHLYFIKRGE